MEPEKLCTDLFTVLRSIADYTGYHFVTSEQILRAMQIHLADLMLRKITAEEFLDRASRLPDGPDAPPPSVR